MKKLLLLILIAISPVAFTSCQSAPSERTVAVHTLQAVGQTAKGAIDTAALLLKNGKIDVAKYQKVSDLYDYKFQPAFSVAVLAVKADYSQPSPVELITLATELANLVASYSQ